MANESSGNYAFYPNFTEYINVYHGIVRAWIEDGSSGPPYVPGKLYVDYSDDEIQDLGYVSDYETAKQYFAELGISLTYPEWVELLVNTPDNAKRSEAWAVGKTKGTDVPNTDETYHNNSKYYADQAKIWTTGNNLSNASVQPNNNATFWANEAHGWTNNKAGSVNGYSATNNAKYWAEQAKGYSDGKGLTEQNIRATDNAEYYKNQSKLWANNGVQGETPGAENNARYWAEQAKSYSDGKNLADSANIRATDNAEYYKNEAKAWAGSTNEHASSTDNAKYWNEQSKLWANNGSAGASPGANNNAKYYAETAAENNAQAESWNQGTRNGSADTVRQGASTNNAKYWNTQAKLWANNGTDGDSPSASNNAKTYAANAAEQNKQAESWAKGTRNGQTDNVRENATIDNASYYSDQSKLWANFNTEGSVPTATNNAKFYAETAASDSLQSESWARGTRAGQPDDIRPNASTDNAKYYSEQADQSAQDAQESNLQAESWTKGTRDGVQDTIRPAAGIDNAAYYSQEAGRSSAAASDAQAAAEEAQRKAEYAIAHNPRINALDNWEIWNINNEAWEDTGHKSMAYADMEYAYQNSSDGTTPPVGTWTSAPNLQSGTFLWIRMRYTWTNGRIDDFYNVTYISSRINSVNGYTGDVDLDGSDLYVDKNIQDPETVQDAITRLGVSITNSEIDALFNVG